MRDRVLKFLQRFQPEAELYRRSAAFPELHRGTAFLDGGVRVAVVGFDDSITELDVIVQDDYGTVGSFNFITNDDMAEEIAWILINSTKEEP